MPYKASDPYYALFVTSSPTTGQAANADSLPTATANKNGVNDGSFTLTVTNLSTGQYLVSGTIPSGYVNGDVVFIGVSATVGGVAAKGQIDSFMIDAKTGYSLAAAGLDSITVTEPTVAGDGAMSTWNFRQLLRWTVMAIARVNRTGTTASGSLIVKKLDGTTSTTQTAADDGAGVESLGAPT